MFSMIKQFDSTEDSWVPELYQEDLSWYDQWYDKGSSLCEVDENGSYWAETQQSLRWRIGRFDP